MPAPITASQRPEEVHVAPSGKPGGPWRDPAPPLLFDIAGIDLNAIAVPVEEIQKYNPHRREAQQIDHVIWYGEGFRQSIASRTIRDNEWWCDGHIPEKPIMPAVMMIEAAAQLTSWMFLAKERAKYQFVGFIRIEKTKFRNKVVPGDHLMIMAKEVKFHIRRFVADTMGIKGDGEIAFESRITGMPLEW